MVKERMIRALFFNVVRTLFCLEDNDITSPSHLMSSATYLGFIECASMNGGSVPGISLGFFIMWKICMLQGGTIKRKKMKEIGLFYCIEAIMGWNPDRLRWVKGYRFLNYTTKFKREVILCRFVYTSIIGEKWQGYLPSNYPFLIGPKFGTPPAPVKRNDFCGLSSISQLRWMSGGQELHQFQSLKNVCLPP